jgi:hypothetical protein
MRAAPTEYGEAGAPKAEENSDVLKEFNARFKYTKAHWDDWRQEARMLYDLVAGRQWDPVDEAKLKDAVRPMVTFNVSGKYMDVITGLQINNRQEIRYYPREVGDAKLNELMTGAVSWGRDLCDQADEETDAFYDAVLTGMGWMEGYLDKDLEPGGVPAGRRVDNMEMYPDPQARKRNLEDARFIVRIRQMDHDEYEELFGEYASETDEELANTLDTDDDGIEIIEEPQDYNSEIGASTSMAAKKGKCPVADYQYWKREKRYLVNHPQLGQKELTEKEHEAYQAFFQMAAKNGQKFQIQPIKRKVYYRALIAKGRVGQHGLSPYQGAITGKRDRNKNTWYGVGRALLDPQRWLNKFFSTILYTLMTNSKGGLMAEEEAFKDARKAESEWANPESITWLKKGALSGDKPKIMPKPPAPYPQGMDRLMEFTLASLPQTTGLNVELMGLADRDQAGVVEAQRKQSAMAIIAWAFDGMRRYYRSVDYVPEGTLVRVNGEASKKYVPIMKQAIGMTFDIVVDEAPTSTNQQERVWLVLSELIPQLLQAGITVPPDVLDYAPIPSDLAQKWKQALQGDPEKANLMKQQMIGEIRKLFADAMQKESQAQLNQVKAGVEQPKAMADVQLKHAQAIKTAAEAGQAQAGGNSGP